MYPALIVFGWIFIAIMLAVVIIPWVRRKRDLLSVWNLFLLGSANFVGFDAVASGWGHYQWGFFTGWHIRHFIFGAIVVYAALFFGYYVPKFPRRWAGKTLRRWPVAEGTALVVMLLVCAALSAWGLFSPRIQGVAQLGLQLGTPAAVIAATFVTVNWLRRPYNGPLAVTFVLVLLIAMLLSVFGTTGRRSLLSVLMVVPIGLYWMHLRNMRLRFTAVPLAILTVVVYLGLAAHTQIRHRHNASPSYLTPFQEAIETLTLIPSQLFNYRAPMEMLPSGSVDASMVCIDLFPKVMPIEPFHTVKFIVANPIPRAFWPGKPEALGAWLSRAYGTWARMGSLNISMGIVGHGFYEGGYHMLIFYGLLIGLCMRYADELLIRQPDNPFLLGALAAASGNIIGLSRGDFGLFLLLILGAVLCTLILRFIARVLFGYGIIYPSDQERAQYYATQELSNAQGLEYAQAYGSSSSF
jgi:hypothetical protein